MTDSDQPSWKLVEEWIREIEDRMLAAGASCDRHKASLVIEKEIVALYGPDCRTAVRANLSMWRQNYIVIQQIQNQQVNSGANNGAISMEPSGDQTNITAGNIVGSNVGKGALKNNLSKL